MSGTQEVAAARVCLQPVSLDSDDLIGQTDTNTPASEADVRAYGTSSWSIGKVKA